MLVTVLVCVTFVPFFIVVGPDRHLWISSMQTPEVARVRLPTKPGRGPER
ncbi:MAG: hypothetical protein U0835_23565 [Isosphaeraceae bacterium]